MAQSWLSCFPTPNTEQQAPLLSKCLKNVRKIFPSPRRLLMFHRPTPSACPASAHRISLRLATNRNSPSILVQATSCNASSLSDRIIPILISRSIVSIRTAVAAPASSLRSIAKHRPFRTSRPNHRELSSTPSAHSEATGRCRSDYQEMARQHQREGADGEAEGCSWLA